MKKLLLTLFLFSGLIFSFDVSAINSEHNAAPQAGLAFASNITVNDFIAFDAKNYRTAEGKKLKWTQRLAFNVVQKNLERKVKKDKIDGGLSMQEAGNLGGKNTYGLLSLIFSIVGLFIPYLGFGLLVAAFVLGIIGIRRDYNPTMAIIGTVISGLVFLLLLILIAIGLSLLWA